MCKTSAGRWVLQGDVSWGSPSCNVNQLYSVFGRVAKFRSWIDMHINGGRAKLIDYKSIIQILYISPKENRKYIITPCFLQMLCASP